MSPLKVKEACQTLQSEDPPDCSRDKNNINNFEILGVHLLGRLLAKDLGA